MGVTVMPRRSPSSVSLLGISCLLWLSIHSPCASSLSFDLNFSEPKPFCGAVINCGGEASVDSGLLELTGKGGVGRATYAQPVPLWHAAATADDKLLTSFATSFAFRITPDPKQRNTGDGMAFFLAPYPTSSLIPPNSGGGNLGLLPAADTSWTGDGRFVAVEFDTWWNGPPADINDNHVAIDVNSIISVASTNTSSPTRNLTSNLDMTATVNYDNGSKLLTVDLQINGSSYHVDTVVDLSSILPGEVAVGFSGATGSSSEMHRVLTWSFTSTLPSSTIDSSRFPKNLLGTVLLSVAVPLLFLSLCVAGGCLLLRRWRRPTPYDDEAAGDSTDSESEEDYGRAELERGVAAGGPRRYTYRELAAATCNFAEDRKLGRGGFGSVYRGQLTVGDQDSPSHVHVAIKVLSSESSAQGRKEFEAEVRIISRLKHRNLVRLLGWCDSRRDGLMLVYELVAQGSLDRHLYGRRDSRFLTWRQRYQIILGLGSALRYLHEEWEQCIVHGDIKPSNIMLDESHCAKLGDFGLARLVDHGAGWQTTKAVLGTAGYIDPEFVNTRRPSTQSDVYSFGVLLLEIVCNRPPVVILQEEEEAASGQQQLSLLKTVWALYGRNATLDAADERLRGEDEHHEQCVERVLVVGLWCAHPDPCQRPSIGQAMHVLQSEDNKGLPTLQPHMYKTMSDLTTVPGKAYGSLSIDDAHSSVSSSAATGNSGLSNSDSSALLANSRDFA